MSNNSINQKEYLQKYLSSDDKLLRKKKKKKRDKEKSSVKSSTVKIIDDDDHGFEPDPEIDEGELYALNEEAPQIVGVIDDRAPDVLMKQEYMDSGKWKTLNSSKSKKTRNPRSPSIEIVGSRSRHEVIDLSPPRKNRRSSFDNSPVRRNTKRQVSDESPPRRTNVKRESPDNSPPRRSTKRDEDASPPRRRRKNSDASPPRKYQNKIEEPSSSFHRSKNRDNSSNYSPPKRMHNDSPLRRKRRDSDNTPPRRKSSPERKPTPERRKKSRWASKSPDRSERHHSMRDNSPPPRVKIERDCSPPRRRESPRRIKEEVSSPPRNKKMSKTLDGKASGLQNAKDLKVENEAHRRRQDDLYRKLDPSLSGRHAKDVAVRDVRDRNKEFEKNYEKDRKKAELEEIRKQQYDKWNKGLKQLDDIDRRRQEIAHEASKPLARAADDKDLEDHLKDQERLEDPMLEYIRSKKKKNDKKEGVLERPQYQGQFPDNRFHLRPGYRWDGVDRSNGYEKKYFDMISAKQSTAEEAYKYSVEDM